MVQLKGTKLRKDIFPKRGYIDLDVVDEMKRQQLNRINRARDIYYEQGGDTKKIIDMLRERLSIDRTRVALKQALDEGLWSNGHMDTSKYSFQKVPYIVDYLIEAFDEGGDAK